MIATKTLKLSLKSLRDFGKKRLPDQDLIDLDARDECPLEIVRHMCSPDKLGIQLLFIPEEYGGMGGGAFDVYCVCEEMARIDLGVATSVLATFLGSDPITVGATPEQKKLWLTRIAEEGILFAYGATEPDAGSDLAALANHRRARDGGRSHSGLQDQRQQAMDQQRRRGRRLHDPGEYARRARAGSSWRKAPRVSATTNRRTSTASASAIPPRSRSTTCMWMRTGWWAAWKARGCTRRRRCSATRA